MKLSEKIQTDLTQAIKDRNEIARETLRMLRSAITNKAIEKKKKDEGLNEEEIVAVIANQIKSRRDSVEQFKAGNRPELAEKEEKEIAVLEKYMPEMMGEDELRGIVKKAIADLGAMNKADFGKVMGKVMASVKGKADGALVKKVVEGELV